MATINELWDKVPASIKLRCNNWESDKWFKPYFITKESKVYGLNHLDNVDWYDLALGKDWQIYKPKLVTWYRPKYFFSRKAGKPITFAIFFERSKEACEKILDKDYKIIGWETMVASEKWEDVEEQGESQ